jgi:protein-tyrosine phosphatase
MIDTHSHILYGLDDGARDEAASLAMARTYAELGFEKIIATPHISEKAGYLPTRFEIEEKVAGLNRTLKDAGVPLELFPGAEYYMESSFVSLAERRWPLTHINGTFYILIEMPALFLTPNVGLSFFNSSVKNPELKKVLPFIRLILAHPERNEEVIKRPEACVQGFKEQGIYIQMNISSLIGYYGKTVKKCAEVLLKAKLVDLAATDAHSSDQLATLFPQALERLEKLAGRKAIEVLLKINPGKILIGETLEPFY